MLIEKKITEEQSNLLFTNAIVNDKHIEIDELLSNNEHNKNINKHIYKVGIMDSIQQNSYNSFVYLINNNHKIIEVDNQFINEIFLETAIYDKLNMMKYLLSNNIHNKPNQESFFSEALTFACYSVNLEMIKYLINYIETECKDSFNFSKDEIFEEICSMCNNDKADNKLTSQYYEILNYFIFDENIKISQKIKKITSKYENIKNLFNKRELKIKLEKDFKSTHIEFEESKTKV